MAWKATVADFKDGYFFTMAPLAVKGKVSSARAAWRDGATRLHRRLRCGQRQGAVADLYDSGGRGTGLTWAGESWKYGGGAVWLTATYDPALNLAFFGVGNPAPWDANLRKGDNLYTDSVLALDVDTGRMKWYYQYHPNDTWDLDTPHEHLLLTVERSGQQVPITFQPNKTGFYFSLDRNTGRFLRQNALLASSISGKT